MACKHLLLTHFEDVQAISSTPHTAQALKMSLCSSVVLLLQATGPEEFIEQWCGGNLSSDGRKQCVGWWRHAQSMKGRSHLQTLP